MMRGEGRRERGEGKDFGVRRSTVLFAFLHRLLFFRALSNDAALPPRAATLLALPSPLSPLPSPAQ
jgi:hypothetical protein